ncbi:a-pheromone receptor PreA, partial [Macrophomina phaseolina]
MADEEFPLYPTAIFLPIAACVVIILDVPPLIWHIRNRNLAAGSLVVWLIIDNFIAFINSLIWPRDNLDQAFTGHGLCDLESYITVAKWTGLCTSVLGITRNLAKVLDTKRQVIRRSRAQQVRELAIDSVICWVPPILQLAVFDVVREYRYYIYGINGCLPSLDGSWLSLVLVFLWPIIASLALAYYAILVLNRLHRYRSDFSRLIQSHSTTRSRFLRLFLLSSLLLLGILPTQSILVWANFPTRPDSYSWSHNHDPGVRGQQIGVKSYGYLIPDRWVSLACGLLVFLFFGLGTDASAMYRSWL